MCHRFIIEHRSCPWLASNLCCLRSWLGFWLALNGVSLLLVSCSAAESPVAVSAQAIVVATGVPVNTLPAPVGIVQVTPAFAGQTAVAAALVASNAQTHRRFTGTISHDLKLSQFSAAYLAPQRFYFRRDDTEFAQVNDMFYLPVGEQWVEAPEWRLAEMQQIMDELLTPASEIVHAQLLGPMLVDGVATQVYEYSVRTQAGTGEQLQQVRLWVRVLDNLPIKRETTREVNGTQVFEILTIDYAPGAVAATLRDMIDQPIAEGRLPGAWREYSSADGQFALLLPGTPQETLQVVETDLGLIEFHRFVVELGSGTYLAAYGDYPVGTVEPRDPEELLTAIQASVTANLQGVLLAEASYSVADYPGRAVRIAVQEGQGQIRLRLLLVGKRLYQIMAVGTPEIMSHSTTDQFLDSFQLIH